MKRILTLCALSCLLAAGCASSRSANTVSRDEAMKAMKTSYGVVEAVRDARIEGTKTPIGAVAGGVMGGVAASAVGEGKGKEIATVGGVLAGAAVGALAEEAITAKKAYSITVKMEDGRTITVVQEADVPLSVGQRVAVLEEGDRTRVTTP